MMRIAVTRICLIGRLGRLAVARDVVIGAGWRGHEHMSHRDVLGAIFAVRSVSSWVYRMPPHRLARVAGALLAPRLVGTGYG